MELQAQVFSVLSRSVTHLQHLHAIFLDNFHADYHQNISDLNTLLLLPKQQKFLAGIYFDSKSKMLSQHEYLVKLPISDYSTQHRMLLTTHGLLPDTQGVAKRSLASQWLLALPNAGLRQIMSLTEFRAALCFRLIIPFGPPKGLKCNSCSHPGADIFHYHALSCGGSGSGILRRHEIFVHALNELAQAAGFYPIMNAPVKCLRYEESGVHWLKPADVLIDGEDVDRCCVDVIIVSPLSDTKAKHADDQICGKLVATAAHNKICKH
jgi:hypothetical protein